MRFRPCIDIHNGKVKQIVGGSLKDDGDFARENFSSVHDAKFYANRYKQDGLKGGHIILLNPENSVYYSATKVQAMQGLLAYPGGMQLGGGITAENAKDFLDAGASHVIVTSYVFQESGICYDNLKRLTDAVGKERIVLDLSCRERFGKYYIVTNRWQNFTDVPVTPELLQEFSGYCDEFLVHGVDKEGKASGMEEGLVKILAEAGQIPITYAGGIASLEDVERLRVLGGGKIDFTIGSALDLFGGVIPYESCIK